MGFGFGPVAEMQKMIRQNARPKRKAYSNFSRYEGGVPKRKLDKPLSNARKKEIQIKLQKQRTSAYMKMGVTFFILVLLICYLLLHVFG